MRIGSGFDVHAFGEGDHVMLGGVRVPHSRGVVAHSDGDVVIHALCDAIFGALALGDIGQHFPPTDAHWRDADSRQFLRHAALRASTSVTRAPAGRTLARQSLRPGRKSRVSRWWWP